MSETPFVDNAVLKIDGSGLACSRAPTSVEAMVGFDLSRGLPGWHGAIAVDVVQGSTTVTAHGSTSFGHHLRLHDYLRVRNVVVAHFDYLTHRVAVNREGELAIDRIASGLEAHRKGLNRIRFRLRRPF